MKRHYTIIELLVALALIAIMLLVLTGIFSLAKGCRKVQDQGLKSVVNEIWEGKQK